MSDTARLTLNIHGTEQTIELPVVTGTEGEKGIDISSLLAKTGHVVLDPAFMNTASTHEQHHVHRRREGHPPLPGHPHRAARRAARPSSRPRTCIIYGKLPNKAELSRFSTLLTRHSMIHEDMKRFFDGYPSTAHPMAILSAMVCSLSSYYPDALDVGNRELIDITIARLLSKVRTIAAFSYKKSIGQPFVYPHNSLSYCANFLNMMFSVPAEPYEIDEDVVKVLNLLLILHADHEQNCSTSTVRLVGSSKANLFASIAAGICALWGPLHGGANQEVVEMLQIIQKDGGDVQKFVNLAKDKSSGFKLMGFGHRVYKNYDPRARLIKAAADKVLAKLGIRDPLLDIALKLEEAALKDPYFVERKLYPNVDFYSGLIYRALGFPTTMFTVMFALGRLPGWIAHWKEMNDSPGTKIGRPRQIYTGATVHDYVPMEDRV